MRDDFDPDRAGTLGFLIDESLEVEDAEGRDDDGNGGDGMEKRGHRVIHRIKRLVDAMTGAHDQASMIKYKELICRLPAKGYGTTELYMTEECLNALIDAGRKAMEKYFVEHPLN